MTWPSTVRSKETEKIKAALEVFGLRLDVAETPEEKKNLRHYSKRAGKVFMLFDRQGRMVCVYSTLAQIKDFIQRKIGG